MTLPYMIRCIKYVFSTCRATFMKVAIIYICNIWQCFFLFVFLHIIKYISCICISYWNIYWHYYLNDYGLCEHTNLHIIIRALMVTRHEQYHQIPICTYDHTEHSRCNIMTYPQVFTITWPLHVQYYQISMYTPQ